MLHAEKIDDKGETKAHRKMGRKMVLKQMGRFLGNSITDQYCLFWLAAVFFICCVRLPEWTELPEWTTGTDSYLWL